MEPCQLQVIICFWNATLWTCWFCQVCVFTKWFVLTSNHVKYAYLCVYVLLLTVHCLCCTFLYNSSGKEEWLMQLCRLPREQNNKSIYPWTIMYPRSKHCSKKNCQIYSWCIDVAKMFMNLTGNHWTDESILIMFHKIIN